MSASRTLNVGRLSPSSSSAYFPSELVPKSPEFKYMHSHHPIEEDLSLGTGGKTLYR